MIHHDSPMNQNQNQLHKMEFAWIRIDVRSAGGLFKRGHAPDLRERIKPSHFSYVVETSYFDSDSRMGGQRTCYLMLNKPVPVELTKFVIATETAQHATLSFTNGKARQAAVSSDLLLQNAQLRFWFYNWILIVHDVGNAPHKRNHALWNPPGFAGSFAHPVLGEQ